MLNPEQRERKEYASSKLTPEFLQAQIRLPKAERDVRFQRLVKRRQRELAVAETFNPDTETYLKNKIAYDMKGLGLDKKTLMNKRILDLGCGIKGNFVKYLTEKGITQEAYGIDMRSVQDLTTDEIKTHFFQGTFEDDLPVKNCDYITSVAAVSLLEGRGEMEALQHILMKAIDSLKEGGEIRIYPIQESGVEVTSVDISRERLAKLESLLVKLSQQCDITYRIEPRTIVVYDSAGEPVLHSVLIIQKKEKKHVGNF